MSRAVCVWNSGVVRVKLLGGSLINGAPPPPPPPSCTRFLSLVCRRRSPWKLQRICILQYLKLGLKLTKNMWMVMHFHVHCSTKSQENSTSSKILNSQVSYQNKMCMFYISSGIIFHKFEKQAKSHRSVLPRSALHVTISE